MNNTSEMLFSYDEIGAIRAYADSCSGNKGRFRGEVIAICGSMKFAEEMKEQELKLTKDGYVVLMPIFCDEHHTTDAEMLVYRESHIKKIKISDAIFVINKDGYVGSHTASEIELASKLKKRIYFLKNANNEML